MPKMMKATMTAKATSISTISGMPWTPTAARISPFSSDMKPTTCPMALRRVIMVSRPSSTTDRASARSSRVSAVTSAVTGSTSRIDSVTRLTPAIMVGPTPSAVSIVRAMFSLTMILCSATGMTTAFMPSASTAVT